jgi:hypothetical protein
MSNIHVPEHQWQKQKRKRRLRNKKRDKKRGGFKSDRQPDHPGDFSDYENVREIMELDFDRQ